MFTKLRTRQIDTGLSRIYLQFYGCTNNNKYILETDLILRNVGSVRRKTIRFVLKRPQFLNYSNISTKLTSVQQCLERYDTRLIFDYQVQVSESSHIIIPQCRRNRGLGACAPHFSENCFCNLRRNFLCHAPPPPRYNFLPTVVYPVAFCFNEDRTFHSGNSLD